MPGLSTSADDPDLVYLWDIREYARRAFEMTRDVSEPDFIADIVLRLAVERAIELIGEAARRISLERRAAMPDVPWREIVGQRNILAHEYGAIDPSRLWHTATKDTGPLIVAINRTLEA
jgi:uncharacterized protein with HEPN domain